LYRECLAGAQIIFPESGRGLGHVTPTFFGSTFGYPSDSLASCLLKQEFQPMWSQSTNVTDGRTDRQTTCDRNKNTEQLQQLQSCCT